MYTPIITDITIITIPNEMGWDNVIAIFINKDLITIKINVMILYLHSLD